MSVALTRLRDFTSNAIIQLRHPNPRKLKEARRYVGTRTVSGHIQFDLLKREGCVPNSRVLEIGCGCLNAGIHIIRYLERGNYVGIDPNAWLREALMEQRSVRSFVEGKQAAFLSREDFDASELGRKFDFIFSHSILSHAAHWQLEQYVKNAAAVLASGGKILSSIRLAEGNVYGSTGTADRQDSMDKEWVYPGVSFFKLSTIQATAEKFGLAVKIVPEYTEYYTKHRKSECHDWMVLTWKNA